MKSETYHEKQTMPIQTRNHVSDTWNIILKTHYAHLQAAYWDVKVVEAQLALSRFEKSPFVYIKFFTWNWYKNASENQDKARILVHKDVLKWLS